MPSVNPSGADDIKRLGKLIKGIGIAMLTTTQPDGTLRSRPMVAQETEFDGDLWFISSAASGKMQEISKDQHVNVSFVDPDDHRYISCSGTARIIRDPAKAKELFTRRHEKWFPSGPDDPQLVLLKVDVHQAEYWDEPGSTMVQLMGLMKAAATGRRYQPGESERIQIEEYPKPRPEPPRGEDLPKSEGSNYAKERRVEKPAP